ncbi:hypothetical protein [Palleronia sp.]|uniref:hypothetical protein n=1 Tax=Palleronia sp. TaxID=1940284 RepID=UPI0035C81019
MVIRKARLQYILTTALTFLPRSALAYPAYCVAPFFATRISDWLPRHLLVLAFIVASLSLNTFRVNISPTVAALEYALCFAFLLGAFGANVDYPRINPAALMRAFQVTAFLTSMFSLVLMGFPARLPYIHYLPDYYYAAFGLGGAKIVTILGFAGIITELHQQQATGRMRWSFLAVAVLNFLMPNYILAIISGAVGLTCYFVRRPVLGVIVTSIALIVVGSYVSYRLETVSGSFAVTFGLHPKIFQFIIASQVFSDQPVTLLTGGGIGQYGGQAAFWTSDVGGELSTFSLPDLPGMFTPEYHARYMEPVMSVFSQDLWAISSSSNKPYSSVSVMAAEFGFPFTFLVFGLIIYRFILKSRDLALASFGVFAMILMTLDRVHDMPWFGLVMIIANTLVLQNRSKNSPLPLG